MKAAAPPDLRRLIEAALPEVREHKNLLEELRRALLEDDQPAVFATARRLVGLPPDVRRMP